MANEIKEAAERTLTDINDEYQKGCAALGHTNYLMSLADKIKQNAENDIAKLKAEVDKLTEKLDVLNSEARALAVKVAEKVKALEQEVKQDAVKAVSTMENKAESLVAEVNKVL